MSGQDSRASLLCTKLQRPTVPATFVPRARLTERVGSDTDLRAVLVTAPAGYGKSTLVASWLQGLQRPAAWLSLDDDNSDIHQFLSYVVAAVRTIFPEALPNTFAITEASAMPPMRALVPTLVNDLAEVPENFILVLDDVHCIRDQDTLEVLKAILCEAPDCLRLVAIGRRDLPLPIASLRASGALIEVRARDLRFTSEEVARFLHVSTGKTVDDATVSAITEKTEGWITGLYLAVLATRDEEEPIQKIQALKGKTRFVADYLLNEVIDRQPSSFRNMLLCMAVLDRFCAPLCDAVISARGEFAEDACSGEGFIDWLRSKNLFVIALDEENRWFRFHHLFAELLRVQLKRSADAVSIDAMHSCASEWFESQGLLDEAIHHALKGSDAERAGDIVERYRGAEFDSNRWYVVQRWMALLPDEIKQRRHRLQLATAWLLDDEFRVAEIPAVLERAEALLENEPDDLLSLGELLYFKAYICFWSGDGQSAAAFLKRVLELAPKNPDSFLRAQAELFAGMSAFLNGQGDAAIDTFDRRLREQGDDSSMLCERLTFGKATLRLLQADLAPAERASQQLRDNAQRAGHTFVSCWGDYMLGLIALQRLDLREARQRFDKLVKNRYVAHLRAAIDSMVGSAIVSELLGESERADRYLEIAREYADWAVDPMYFDLACSGEARVALLRGNIDAAVRWQRSYDVAPNVPSMLYFLDDPGLTVCRVLVATKKSAELDEAARKLREMRQQIEALHNRYQTVEVVALQALVADRQGRADEALEFLDQALELAQPGEWIRPFVEPGAGMKALLQRRMASGDTKQDQILRILDAFGSSSTGNGAASPLPEPLTWREQQVMRLLAQRMRNKEISAQLNISSTTVKSHLRNIFQKLDVHERRDAVARATELGIVS